MHDLHEQLVIKMRKDILIKPFCHGKRYASIELAFHFIIANSIYYKFYLSCQKFRV